MKPILSVLTALGLCIAIGVVSYFGGISVEKQRGANLVSDLDQVKTEIVALNSLDALRQANLWVYRTVAALDNRNFGVANDADAAALKNLQAVDAARVGIDPAELLKVQKEMTGVKISIASDLESQRTQILTIAKDLTALNVQAHVDSASPSPAPTD